MVDQRRCRRILKKLKQCVLPIFAFLRLNTTFSTLLMSKNACRPVHWDVDYPKIG